MVRSPLRVAPLTATAPRVRDNPASTMTATCLLNINVSHYDGRAYSDHA